MPYACRWKLTRRGSSRSLGASAECRLCTADPLRRLEAVLLETPASPSLYNSPHRHMPVTTHQMIIDHSCRLHMGIDDSRADETKAAFFQRL